jgi:hypothetical protein
MASLERLTEIEAENAVEMLNSFYMIKQDAKDQKYLGFRFDLFEKKYFLDTFFEYKHQNSPILTFKGSNEFKSWLLEQTNQTLSEVVNNDTSLSPILIEDIRHNLKRYNQKHVWPGPYQIMDQRGDTHYPVHPIVYAIENLDAPLFDKALQITTTEQRKVIKSNFTTLLQFCFKRNFKHGVEQLLALDGPCCNLSSFCYCLQTIGYKTYDNNQYQSRLLNFNTDINLLLFNQIKSIEQIYQMEVSDFELRLYFKNLFKSFNFNSPIYLWLCLKNEYDFEFKRSMDVMRELENFPEVNLNQKDENGDTSFMLYLKNSDLDENVLIKMLENGANLTDITDFGQSTLDLVMQNKKTSEVNKKLILSKMFRLGVRSKHKNFLIKVYRNLRSKY